MPVVCFLVTQEFRQVELDSTFKVLKGYVTLKEFSLRDDFMITLW